VGESVGGVGESGGSGGEWGGVGESGGKWGRCCPLDIGHSFCTYKFLAATSKLHR
jgi:hypothetical protein